MFVGWIWWNDGLTPPICQPVAQPPGIIGAISNQLERHRHGAEILFGADKVMGVARCHAQGKRASKLICQRVDFARATSTRIRT